MAYVAPNSIVQFYGDLGLNDNYDDSLYFASTEAKDAYFSNASIIIATAQNVTYTREHRNFIRVEIPMVTLIGASYMRFKNTSFENKWFYAFIKNVEYINNSTTQINFQIDPLMTWMGSFTLNQCFIERQHTPTDIIGENLLDEGLETGDVLVQGVVTTNYFTDWGIYIFQSVGPEFDEAEGQYMGGIYSGLYAYYCSTPENANTELNALEASNLADSVVAIKMLPTHFVDNLGSTSPTSDYLTIDVPKTSLGSYTPRNKKLFVYPYNYLSVYNTEGDVKDYRYEFFNQENDNNVLFNIRGIGNVETEVMCTPCQYRGMAYDYSESITMKDFPSCSWNVDSFKAYLAQAESMLGVNLANDLISAGMALPLGAMGGAMLGAMGAPGLALAGAATAGTDLANLNAMMNAPLTGGEKKAIADIGNIVAMKALHPTMPVVNKGSQTSNVFVGSKTKNFYFYKMCIRPEYARIIDDYFDMFGYAIRRKGVPNMNARPYWTYVKTVGCSVSGRIPADDASTIEKIFNAGIRFWKSHTQIGKYSSYDNSPS